MSDNEQTQFQYRYERMRIPAIPTLQCEVAVEIAPEPGKVWVPVRAICEDALHIDNSTQQTKIRDDERFMHCRRLVPSRTPKGMRPSLALEFEGFIPWVIEIEEGRVDEDSRRYVHTFRRLAWAFLSRLALNSGVAELADGRTTGLAALPAPLSSAVARPVPRGRAVGQRIIEERVDALEEAVYVKGATSGGGRIIRCIACGFQMEIEVESLHAVPAHNGEPQS